MGKTKIEWCDYTLNPVKGLCPMSCSYCYARALYKRFKWDEEVRWDDSVFWHQLTGKPGDKYFVGSTIELFGDWIEDWWMTTIFQWVRAYPQRIFIFLTKQPQNLYKWSPFPDNAWVGISATNNDMAWAGSTWLKNIEAGLKFISFEPLLAPMHSDNDQLDYSRAIVEQVDWVIIGAQKPYNKKTFPKWEWIREIIDACDKSNIPVFLKNNLRLPKLSCEGGLPFYKKHPTGTMVLRQEFPK